MSQERRQWYVNFTRLREMGYSTAEIARVSKVSIGFVNSVFRDPTGVKEKLRKDQYRSPCPICGDSMAVSSRRSANKPQMCDRCYAKQRSENRYWTREKVVLAIQSWAREYGRPPRASEWRQKQRTAEGVECPAAARVYDDAGPFNSWSEAVAAAGFTPRQPVAQRASKE